TYRPAKVKETENPEPDTFGRVHAEYRANATGTSDHGRRTASAAGFGQNWSDKDAFAYSPHAQSDYFADPDNVSAAFLFGHVAILQSGYLDYDGHLSRPMPADSYYAAMNGYWPTDPDLCPSYFPLDL